MSVQWDVGVIEGPDGDDWRVPVTELESRQARAAAALADAGIEAMLVHDPVDSYWLCGSRQAGAFLLGAEGSGIQAAHLVRQSIDRARWEAGEGDSPHEVTPLPRAKELSESLSARGLSNSPALQLGRMPHSDANRHLANLSGLGGDSADCTQLLWDLRETKSDWEVERLRESGEVNRWMFEAILDEGDEGVSEIELAAAADSVSRASGFGGHVRMRRWPMDCDRVVIAAGGSGSVPSFFDSAVGGTGPHPLASLGAGFHRIKVGEPVLVDIVHCHRGYVSDCTRMFSVGPLDAAWEERLADMVEIRDAVVASLGRGEDCEVAYEAGHVIARERGHAEHLMGMPPEQAKFLGHSIGLELDETPVVARGFARPLHQGGTMAIEPKVIHTDGAIGTEDTWLRTDDGMECLTAGDKVPLHQEW